MAVCVPSDQRFQVPVPQAIEAKSQFRASRMTQDRASPLIVRLLISSSSSFLTASDNPREIDGSSQSLDNLSGARPA